MLNLVVLKGADCGREFKVTDGQPLLIGRGADSDTRLRDPTVSRLHCRVLLQDGRPVLEDNGSSGGTFVNGERVDRRFLFPDDTIRLGETQMRVQIGNAAEFAKTLPPRPRMPSPDDTVGGGDTTFELGDSPPPEHATMVSEVPLHRDLSFLLGKSIEQYRIVKEIATGKSGVLFLAVDQKRDREVALKVVWPDICAKQADRRRFKEAMRSMYGLDHPSIVGIYRAGSSRFTDRKEMRLCWTAMEYVPGCSFRYLVDRAGVAGMLDWSIAWRAAIHIAEALVFIHGKGVVHRNISPDNILLSQAENRAKLSDLMIARATENAAERVTRQGELVGEVAYMPPERTEGLTPLDFRSDIYSLGATLYAVVSGQPPFQDPQLHNLIRKIQQDDPVPPSAYQLAINPLFEGIILKMMAKNPEHRFQTATDLLVELERVSQTAGITE